MYLKCKISSIETQSNIVGYEIQGGVIVLKEKDEKEFNSRLWKQPA